jgi:hypothetical protein
MENEKNYTGLIPDEREGWAITATSSRTEADIRAAQSLYALAGKRLLDVNRWETLLKGKLGAFQLSDENGQELDGLARAGCFLRIDIVGPGTESGDGYDWVRIEAVETFENDNIEQIAMRVRPAPKPGSDVEAPGVETPAHFYNEHATSTFTVTREGECVTASIYDRNTSVNTEGEGLMEKVRNTVFGFFGKIAFSKIQWKDLTDGLLS